jgi:DHA1 family multidrug resistance protein-like MFS transporter
MSLNQLPAIISVFTMQKNRCSIIILFFTLAVAMLGFGIIIPILPFYIEHFGASGTSLGLLMASFAIMQFLCAPLWGALSDRCGRKPVLIIGVIGTALSHLLFGLSTELWMLFASRILAGILSSATMPTAMAYIADRTSIEERSSGIGILRAALGVGIILGPGLGGWFASVSLSFPFFVAAGLSVVAVLPIVLALPESLPRERRTHGKVGVHGFQLSTLGQVLFGPMGFLLLLAFLLSFGLTGFEGIFGLYTLKLYGYGPERLGTIFVLIGVISAIMQGVVNGPLSRRLGEVYIIQVSLLVCAIGFVLMLQADTFYEVLLTVSFFIISSSLLRPALASLISKRTTIAQGKTLGLNSSFMSLGRVFGPACAGFLFDVKMSYPFLSGAVVMMLGFFGSLLWLQRRPLTSKKQ